MLDPNKLKKKFPILNRKIDGKKLVYLDNAATSQKPKIVINALKKYYETSNANVNRGLYALSEESTAAYENCRETVAKFINAESDREIIFTRNCTESINLVSYSWGEKYIKQGDEIIVSELEHHANLVPWQALCKKKKARLKVIPLKKDYTLDFPAFKKLLSKKTKLLALTGMSNVLGTIPPIKKYIDEAHKHGTKVLIDGAQLITHSKVDMRKLDCDFFAFSAHKLFGPTGVGILYGKSELLTEMPPFQYGGDMIRYVGQYESTYNDIPWKFEAGTPNIADVIAFEKALKFIEKIGHKNIETYEKNLLSYAKKVFARHKEVQILSPKNIKECGPVLSIAVRNIHPHDIAAIFNENNVCIRAGHHCAHPLMKVLGVVATARLSFSIYNTREDIDDAEKALQRTLSTFR